MQITFTTEQLSWVHTGVNYLSTIFTLWAMLRRGFKYLEQKVNQVITENTNRGVKETKDYVDRKFKDHATECDNVILQRLDAQDRVIATLINSVIEINERLKTVGK